MARLKTECASDVDPSDMLVILELIMACLAAEESHSFDGEFVKEALLGKVSAVERTTVSNDPKTILRKNRPIK